jgi:hypothetical protein
MACPRLTNTPYTNLPPTPPAQTYEYVDSYECPNIALPPSPPQSPPPPQTFSTSASTWSFLDPASKQGSCCSFSSDDSGYESDAGYAPENPILAVQPFNFYGNIIPLNDVAEKSFFHQQAFIPSMVAAY